MTQEQLLKMEHLKIAEVKPGMFVHIHAEDGYAITAWDEQSDIKEYSGSICMWMPIRDSYDDNYRIITIAEHEDFEARQREAIEAEMTAERNKMNA